MISIFVVVVIVLVVVVAQGAQFFSEDKKCSANCAIPLLLGNWQLVTGFAAGHTDTHLAPPDCRASS
jgi:hypothetical protein